MDHYSGWEPSYLKYTINLNEEARAGNLDPVAARDKEINQLINILSRRTKNSPLLIGEPGIGKTAVVEGFVQKIIRNEVPKSLQNKFVLQLDIPALIAGARHKGEFEQRLRELISDLMKTDDIILFVDDIHLLLTEDNEHINAASIFKKYMDENMLTIIGSTTQENYEKYFDKNKAFERHFQPVQLDQPTEEGAFTMLQTDRAKFENFHKVTISDETLRHAVSLSVRHIPERPLPDKAIDVIDEAAARVKLHISEGKRKSNSVRKDDIENIISEWIGVPLSKLTQDESQKLLMLENLIHKKFVGQQNAVTAVSEAIRRGRIGLGSATRPVASFLFFGPSGVGKTELVKVLSQVLHDRDDAMLQLDMSEFMEKQDVSKLIGAPPGFAGYEEGGILTEAVSKRPSQVILFDNIDRAHADIANILLQLLEEGHLTDNRGKQVSFKNTVIICTTTNGHDTVREKLQSAAPDTNETDLVKKELLRFFKPETLNRFDGIITFASLSPEEMVQISKLLLNDTAAQLKKQEFIMQTTDKAVDQIAKTGYSPKEGARPLRRVITEVVENPVAVAIISGQFKEGDTLLVEYIPEKGFAVTNGATEILNTTKIMLPDITEIAQYDTALMKKEKESIQEVTNIYEFLKKLAKPETVTDQAEKARLEDIWKHLQTEKAKGNPTADVILLAIQSFKQENSADLPLPVVNDVQVVSDEEFEQVRVIWLENYLDRESMGNSIEAQIEWIKNEDDATQNIMKVLSSENPENKGQAMKDLVSILPIFLIGGFTKDQIFNYLKIKSEAAKFALAQLQEEQETLLTVSKSQPKSEEKVMQVQY